MNKTTLALTPSARGRMREFPSPRLAGNVFAVLGLLTVSAGILAAPVGAQRAATIDIPEGYTVAFHVIRPGDTFISVTKQFLGSSELWPLVADLNPDLKERALPPGKRMGVLLDPERRDNAARIVQHAGDVEEQPNPIDWLDVSVDDMLISGDATRTDRGSSTQLLFADSTRLTITEESIVFLRQGGGRLRGEMKQREVEIVRGQADLNRAASSKPPEDTPQVEMVMGRSHVRITDNQPLRTRAARTADGKAKLGMYQGKAAFENAGQSVEVNTGEGVVVQGSEVPKPEKLLPAPHLGVPAAGNEHWSGRELELTWQMPADASGSPSSYTFELCGDPDCGQLATKLPNISTTRHAITRPAAGDWFWRITPVATSGLDGYPSEARALRVVDVSPDQIPPVARIVRRGGAMPPGEATGGAPIIGQPALEISSTDEGLGVEREMLVVNGVVRDPTLRWRTGRYDVRAEAIDRAGLKGQSETLTFFVDADPPTISLWPLPTLSIPDRPIAVGRKRRNKQGSSGTLDAPRLSFVPTDQPLAWSVDGLEWRPLATDLVARITTPQQLSFHTLGNWCARPEGRGGDCIGPTFRVDAEDALAGISRIQCFLEGSPTNGSAVLVVQAEDRVGNTQTERYSLTQR